MTTQHHFAHSGTIFFATGMILLMGLYNSGCKKPVEYSDPVGLSSPSASVTPLPGAAGTSSATPGSAPIDPKMVESRKINKSYLDAYSKSNAGKDSPELREYQKRTQ